MDIPVLRRIGIVAFAIFCIAGIAYVVAMWDDTKDRECFDDCVMLYPDTAYAEHTTRNRFCSSDCICYIKSSDCVGNVCPIGEEEIRRIVRM